MRCTSRVIRCGSPLLRCTSQVICFNAQGKANVGQRRGGDCEAGSPAEQCSSNALSSLQRGCPHVEARYLSGSAHCWEMVINCRQPDKAYWACTLSVEHIARNVRSLTGNAFYLETNCPHSLHIAKLSLPNSIFLFHFSKYRLHFTSYLLRRERRERLIVGRQSSLMIWPQWPTVCAEGIRETCGQRLHSRGPQWMSTLRDRLS